MIMETDYFSLFLEGETVKLNTKRAGYPIKSFERVLKEYPRLKITSFGELRKALAAEGETSVIGKWLPRVELEVSSDQMTAYVLLHCTPLEYQDEYEQIVQEGAQAMEEAGILYGRKEFPKTLTIPVKPILVAEGISPIKGTDAIIRYIEQPPRKPVIREDGVADYYEMHFVTPIVEGQWLGEKLPPTNGEDGITIFGTPVPAVMGDDLPLQYDSSSVIEMDEGNKTVLRARYSGALDAKNGIVGVSKHLTVDGDVGPETGSISFEGSITVKGIVHPEYSVTAAGDISIEGDEGVANAKLIQSSEGDIYIKGGVFGGGETIIEAKGSIYLKHANNCKLFATEIHVGLYLIGTESYADRVLVNKSRGKIIGGTTSTLFRIECAYAGNNHERKTELIVTGINKEQLFREIKQSAQELKERMETIKKLEHQLQQIEPIASSLQGPKRQSYEQLRTTLSSYKEISLELDREIQEKLARTENKEEAEIEVTTEAFPGTIIQVGKMSTTLLHSTKGVFKLEGGVLNV